MLRGYSILNAGSSGGRSKGTKATLKNPSAQSKIAECQPSPTIVKAMNLAPAECCCCLSSAVVVLKKPPSDT